MRKITSMTMLFSLVVLIINSVLLYIVPEGRVAYWSDWRFWGLSKTDWADQHVTVGFLFLIAGLLHIYYNFAAIKSYLKNKVKEVKLFSLPATAGLLITAVVVIITYFQLPPASFILNLGAHFKESGAEKFGEPPYGHAELSSLQMFCQKERINLEQALALFQKEGLVITGPDQTLLAIARANNRTPQQVYTIITPAKENKTPSNNGAAITFPDEPKPGFGRKTLEQVCTEYQIDLAKTTAGLRASGLKAEPGETIHQIAEANGKEPMELFEAIRKVVLTSGK